MIKPFDIGKYREGMGLLWDSGVLHYLKDLSIPMTLHSATPNYAEASIAELGRLTGYRDALDSLTDFEKRFALDKETQHVPVSDFGARNYLIEQKIINEKEKDELTNWFAKPRA